MSLFFKHFHKIPFWSQLFLGTVAIFALPEIQAIQPNESEQESVINQPIIQHSQSTVDAEQQSPFTIVINNTPIEFKVQEISFCEFITNYYQLDKYSFFPIRAGPIA